jgi:hypothetical protein
MTSGRALIEASTRDGVLEVIEGLQRQFHHVSATIPELAPDGRYLSSVIYSNDLTVMEVAK